MRYPQFSRAQEYRVSVPQLNGGINQAEAANVIGDNQLTDACNLWWKDGKLRSRPVLRPVDTYDLGQYPIGLTDLSASYLYPDDTSMGGTRGHHVELTFGTDDLATFGVIGVSGDGHIQEYPYTVSKHNVGDSNALYIEGGGNAGSHDQLLMINGDLYKLGASGYERVAPYIPIIAVQAIGDSQNILSAPGGYSFEGYNMLTDAFQVNYVVRQGGLYFHLPSSVKGVSGTLTVRCIGAKDGVVTHTLKTQTGYEYASQGVYAEAKTPDSPDRYVLHYSQNTATFWFLPDEYSAANADDLSDSSYACLEAVFTPDDDQPAGKSVIGRMTFGTWYGGDRSGLAGGTRFFVSGNPSHPNLVHYSALNDPTYFPENSYAYIGASSDPVTAFGKQSDMLVIFKSREIYYADYAAASLSTEGAMNGGVIDAETQSAVFPITPLSAGIGCDCPKSIVLCANRLVWLTTEGKVYTLVTGNQYSERNVREISDCIEPMLKKIPKYVLAKASAADYDGCYLLAASQDLFLFNYADAGFVYLSSSYSGDTVRKRLAWHRWQLPRAFPEMFASGDSVVFLDFLYIWPRALGMKAHLVTYRLEPGDADTLYEYGEDENGNPGRRLVRTHPLASSLTTKQFDFRYPERHKNIRLVTVTAGGEAPQKRRFRFADEKGMSRDETLVQTDGNAPVRITPGMRHVRRFAVRIDATGEVWYDDMTVLYSFYAR